MSFETLPVEILHRIFDHLDTLTILQSIRYICKRFYSTTLTYNRYSVNFQSISKRNFRFICRIIDWNNIRRLILSDDDRTPGEVALFLFLVPIPNFTRLQSITLLDVDGLHLKTIFKHIRINCNLHSLTLTATKSGDCTAEVFQHLSAILEQASLRRVDLSLGFDVTRRLSWPNRCTVEHLRLYDRIDFELYCNILRSSSNLHTLILRDCRLNSSMTTSDFYPQLKSLSLDDSILGIEKLETLISLTPCLVHVKLICCGNGLFNGSHWQQFLEHKLPELGRFEFSFQGESEAPLQMSDLESMLNPFRSSFWLEVKRWFVALIAFKDSNSISLYSMPVSASGVRYRSKTNKILCSTVPATLAHELRMRNIDDLRLNLNELCNEVSDECLFPGVYKLTLHVHDQWPSDSAKLLSMFVDLSLLNEIILDVDWHSITIPDGFIRLGALLEQTPNLQSLILRNTCKTITNLCEIIPRHVRHLQVKVIGLDEAKMILERLTHLSSVMFTFTLKPHEAIAAVIDYLRDQTDVSLDFKRTEFDLKLWLGTNCHLSPTRLTKYT